MGVININKKYFIFISLILCVFVSLSAVCASDINDTDIQTKDHSQNSLINSVSDNIKSNNTGKLSSENSDVLSADTSGLQTAINNAGATLSLTKDYTITDTVNINKEITIDGKGKYTINGNNAYRIFSISGNNVVLKNIIFKNAKVNSNDGAAGIYWTGSGAKLINCTFENCVNTASDGKGGAVYFDQQAYVSDSTFKSCKASTGGAIYLNAKNNTVINSVFMSNQASYSGVAYNRWIESNNFINCVYLGNTATVSGNEFSRAAASNKNATYTITDLANTITGKTSVILNANYMYYETTDYTNYYNGIKINEAITIDGNAYILNGNNKVKLFFINCANVVLKNINFINAKSIQGASPSSSGVDAGGAISVKYSGHKIINCTFTDCIDDTAASGGGAIRVSMDSHNVLIDSCKFINNKAKDGGAIYVNKGDYDVNIKNCQFIRNSAQSPTYGAGNGGAISCNVEVQNVFIDNCTFNSNNAVIGGAGFSYSGVNVNNSKYSGNSATTFGKNFAISFTALQENINKLSQGSTFNLYADVIYLSSDSSYLKDTGVNITANKISIKGNGYTIDASSSSRMFNVIGEKITIENLNLINGKFTSASDGGSIYLSGKDAKISFCNFTNNQAKIGGALYILYTATGTTISDCNFKNNKATSGNGGAIWADIKLTVSGSYFYKNSATSLGGAIYHKNGDLNINNSTFIENSATTRAGGVYSDTAGYVKTLNSTIFLGNTAGNDNHYYLGGTVRKINITLTFSDLRLLIKNAQDSGKTSVTLDANYKYYSTDGNNNPYGSCSSGIEIKQSSSIKTIDGAGYTLDSAGSDLHTIVIWKNNNNFNLKNINIINAYRSYHASAIYSAAVGGKFQNIQIINCSVSIPGREYGVSGGCVYVTEDASSTSFTNVNFTRCSLSLSSDADAGAYAGGAAIRLGSSSSSLINCIFRDCHSNWDGGAALIGNAWLATEPAQRTGNVLRNCEFINCSSKYGPAVYFYNNANVNIYDCTFKYNHGVGNGGSVWFGAKCKTFNIEGCTFIGNDASVGNGGALYIGANLNGVTINKCNFIENNATQGGAIIIIGGAQNIEVKNCNFTNNTAKYGGAGYANTATITLTNLKYNGNKASIVGNNFLLPLTPLKNTIDGLSAGATYTLITDFMYLPETDKDLSKEGIVISKKITLNGNGLSIDAMQAMRIFSITADGVTFNNITFKGGNSSSTGGALSVSANNLKINDCSFINNKASAWGGAIQLTSGKTGFSIKNTDFINNTVLNGGSACNLDSVSTITNCKFINNTITVSQDNTRYGGALRLSDAYTATNTLSNLVFIGNKAINAPAGGFSLLSPATMNGIFIFENNTAKIGGGMVARSCDGLTFTANFTNNKATLGSAFYFESANVNIKGNFISNNAKNDGCIYINGTNAKVEGNFINNVAGGSGGAVYVEHGVTNGVTLRNSKFINNSAEFGGALNFRSPNNKVYDSEFINNSAQENGGALEFTAFSSDYSINGYLVSGCKFINNTAKSSGGAVSVFNSVNTVDLGQIINCEFEGNNASNGGAIIMSSPKGVITNSKFLNNSATIDGGAIKSTSSDVDIKYSNFTKNMAKGDNSLNGGGAIHITGINTEIIECNFLENEAVRGAGVYINAQNALVSKCNFIKNNASGHGGAIYIYSNGGNSVIKDCIFKNNSAKYRGGAIWSFANIEINNCTMTYNHEGGDGTVFAHDNSVVTIKKSILLNNTAGGTYWNIARNSNTGSVNIEDSILDAIVIIKGDTVVYGNLITGSGVFNDGTYLTATQINLTTGEGILLTNSLNINSDKSFIYSLSKSLAVGNYTLVVGNIDSKRNKYIFTVAGNFTIVPANSTITTKPVNITYEDADIAVTVSSVNATGIHYIITDLNGTVKYEGDTSIVNGIFTISNNLNLDVGSYLINLTNNVDKNHTSAYNTTTLTVKPYIIDLGISSSVEVYPNKVTVYLTADRDGNFTVNVDGKNYNVEVKGGRGNTTLDILTAGNHTVNVTSNITNYYATKKANVSVIKSNSTISLSINPITQTFTVTVTPGATGNVTIKVNDTMVIVNLDLAKGNTIVIGGLGRNTYNATAIYNGDQNYNSSNCSEIFEVTKSISAVNVTLDNNIISYGDSVKVTVSVFTNEINPYAITGIVNVTIGGKTQTINLNDNDNSTIFTNLAGGKYNVEVVYYGNDYYTASTNYTQTLVVNPIEPTLVITPADIVYGQTLAIDVELTGQYAGVTGDVTFTLNGVNYTVSLVNGKARVNYTNVPAGSNTVYVNYTGDRNYSGIYTSKVFNVAQAKSNVNATSITTINYADNLTIVVNSVNATKIKYQIINSTGSIILQEEIAAGENINITNLKIDVGTYTLNLTTVVDSNHTSITNSSSKIIVENATINSLYVVCDSVDYLVNATVVLYSDVDGKYIITVNNKNYDVVVSNGEGRVFIDVLDAGNYTVNVLSNVKNYNVKSNNTNFTVKKINSTIVLTVNPTIQNFTIVAPKNAKGIVTVIVKGTSLRGIINLTNGETSVQIDGFEDGGYDAYAVYSGDNNYYNSTSNEIEFIVNKLHVDLNTTFNTTILYIGDNVAVYLNLSSDATGYVTFKLDNETKLFNLSTTGNNIKFDLNSLSGGRHYWEVYYSGDYKYGSLNITGDNRYLDVNKIISNVVINAPNVVVYGDKIIVNVTLSPNKARGNVTVRFGSQSQTYIFVDENSHNFTFNTEPVMSYNIVVDYAGNENYTFVSANKAISVINANISFNITTSLIYPDATLIINSSADGKYSVMVDSVMYNVTVVNGTGKLILNSPLSSGDHKINITADIINYNPFNKIQTLKVINGTILVNATVINATYPNQAMIFVNASVDGNYIVTVNGTDYTVNVINGTGNITFNRIAANNYTVTIKRNLANYNPVNVIYNLTISKNTPNINVTVVDVIYPNVVAVNITSDVDGTYVLRIGNKINETTLTAGVSKIVTISGLAANEVGYVVNVTYAETQNYTAAFNDTRVVKVFRASSSVNASSVVVVYGDVISIDVTAFNASGVVWEIYSGSVCVLNGTAVIMNNATILSGIDLAVGNYSVVLTTVVDANHTSVVNTSSTLNITKYTPKINVTVEDVVYSNVVYVNVTSDVNGTFVITIDGITNSTELTAGVSKIVAIAGLAANESGYVVNVTYAETQNYTAAFNDTRVVKVFRASSSVNASSVVVVYRDAINIDVTAINASGVVWEIYSGSVCVLNGTAVISNNVTVISGVDLAVGNYSVVLTTVVDANHSSVVNSSATLNVTKYTPKINVVVVDVVYPGVIRVNVTSDVSGTYVVGVGGVLNTTVLTANVSKVIEFYNFSANESGYVVNVTYVATQNYTDAFNDTRIVKVFRASSSVNASSVVVVYGDVINIDVAAFNASGVVWEIYSGSVKVLNGTEVIVDNATVLSGIDLAVGNYSVVLTTVVDANHTSVVNSSATLNITKYTPKINVAVVDVTYPGIVSVTITSDVNGTYVLRIGGKVNETTLTAGVSKTVTISNLAANEVGYIVNVTYRATQNYTDAFNDTEIVKVFKAMSSVNGSSIVVVYRDAINIDVTAINASGVVWEIYDGSVCVLNGTAVISNNVTVISGVDLAVGNYSVVLTTVVDANHTSVVNSSSTLNITKYTPKIIVTVVDVVYPNIVYVNVTTDVSGTYNVRIGDKFTSDELIAGVSKLIPIIGLDANEIGYNVNVTYDGTQNYTGAFNDENTVRVFKANSSVSASSKVVVYGDRIVIDIIAVNASSVSWEIKSGTTTVLSDISQVTGVEANISDIKLPVGNYTIVLTTNVDLNHNSVTDGQTTLNITQCVPEIIVVVNPKTIVYEMDTNITVILPGDATGVINITYNNISYSGKLQNGTVDIIIPNIEPGDHNLTVLYSGDNNYKNATSYAFFKVYNKLSFVNVSAYDIFRDENITITMTVPADATGNISVKIGNKSYNIPIKEGKANLTLSNLTPGMYIINATYAGDNYYSGSSNDTVSFKVKTRNTIISQDGVRAYNSGVDYEVKFTDELDRPLVNTEITLTVDGKTYKLKTDENGTVKFNEKMSVGNHTIDVVNPVTGESLQSSFSIVKRLEETEEVKQKGYTLMDFKDGSYYVVRVIGDDGNPVGSGVPVNITVNGVTYTVITDSEGYARLAINLNPKEYEVVSEYSGDKLTSKIVVNQILKAKKVQKIKKSSKRNKLKASLKLDDGTPVSGQLVTMKLKGKIFKATTNSKGIAKFKIPKKIVKKLKVGKKYKIYFCYVTNYIYKYVKIKR